VVNERKTVAHIDKSQPAIETKRGASFQRFQ
jgi:hypothetical protein